MGVKQDLKDFLQALFADYVLRCKPSDMATARNLDEYLAFSIKARGICQQGWTPLSFNQFYKAFQGDPDQACYVNTATLRMGVGFDGKTPTLRHKNEYIQVLPAFILDDIGTRTQPADLPVILQKPTTIVETSSGNFQYGYRLTKPFTDIHAARNFITSLYSMGAWDGGGAVAAKFIRLPCGINGKLDQGKVIPGKTDFKVKLLTVNQTVELDPDQVLTAVGFDPTSIEAKKRQLARAMMQDAGETFVSGDGIADALMPWLEKSGQLFSGGDVWQTVICPWHEEHSKGGNITAGYKPLGLGTGDNIYYRQFNCFHSHCIGRRIKDYLVKLQEDYEHFPEGVYAYDPTAKLLRDYIYIASAPGFDSGCIVNIDTGQKYPVPGFRNLYARKVLKKSLAAHFLESPIRPMADELRSRPDLTHKAAELVFRIPDTQMTAFNDFRPLDFPEVKPDMTIIKPFLDHAEYLMPNFAEREYVLNWMAAKVQDPSFRGAVIVMVAPKHGTGRTTWWRMFGRLLPPGHYGEISSTAFHSEWDDWMTNLLTVCSEVTDKTGATDRWNLSEVFKTRFDTSPSFLDLNIKTKGMLRNHMCCMSFVALTNHPDAMRIDESDRRIYVVSNPLHPRPPSYFEKLFAWERSEPSWRQHLYWWFKKRDLTGWDGFAPAPMTQAKLQMMKGSDGPVGAAVRALMEVWEYRYIEPRQVRLALEPYQCDLMQHVQGRTKAKLDQQIKVDIQRHTLPDGVYAQVTIDGKKTDTRQRVDLGSGKVTSKGTLLLRKGALPGQQDVPRKVDWKSAREAVEEALVPFGISDRAPGTGELLNPDNSNEEDAM